MESHNSQIAFNIINGPSHLTFLYYMIFKKISATQKIPAYFGKKLLLFEEKSS